MEKKNITIFYKNNTHDTLKVNTIMITEPWFNASDIVKNNDDIFLLDIDHAYINTTINLTNVVPYVICNFNKETGEFKSVNYSLNQIRSPFFIQTQNKIILLIPMGLKLNLDKILKISTS